MTEKRALDDLLEVGGKASSLLRLQQLGLNVPSFTIIPAHVLLDQLPAATDAAALEAALMELKVPAAIIDDIANHFGDKTDKMLFAVRSSGIDEDGAEHSFAGQFETSLNVPFKQLQKEICRVWRSAFSERVMSYRKAHQLNVQAGLAVIVQEMVQADSSGVAFGLDPVTGDQETFVISSVFGLGEGLVSGTLDADTFHTKDGQIESRIAHKAERLILHPKGRGVVRKKLDRDTAYRPSLKDEHIHELAQTLELLNKTYEHPQDVEFAYVRDQLYVLQSRNITTNFKGTEPNLPAPNPAHEEYILWDNSNIVESYPGVTTPLTYSFIIRMYEAVYIQFVKLLGVREKEVEKHAHVFANTLGLVRGRVYYNLLSWYKMLAMVPGYSINAQFMETMMGVKERFELAENYRMSKGLAWFRIVGMLFNMIRLHFKLPGERKWFLGELEKTFAFYREIDLNRKTPEELRTLYLDFEETLVKKWKAPLINDFFAMIWFGVLQKLTVKYQVSSNPNIHNDLLCGSSDIISTQPIHRTIALAGLIANKPEAKRLFETKEPEAIWSTLQSGTWPDIYQGVLDYLEDFGDRCIGELKLESISYKQRPALFVRQVKSYVEQGIITPSKSTTEQDIRDKAEQEVAAALKGKPIKKRIFNYVLRQARDLVSNRENLRYERTRGFGTVRTLFSQMGVCLAAEARIDHPRDIFYLKQQEVLEWIENDYREDLRTRIAKRKAIFEGYRTATPPAERFSTYGNNFIDEYIYSTEKIEAAQSDLQGIGCCPGVVEGNVRVIHDPTETSNLNGDILVTSSTDPGWVTLFPTCSALLVEKGSLLSHSAIVAREMGIPCVVSVSGLLRSIKDGDRVKMDGSTGAIQIIRDGQTA